MEIINVIIQGGAVGLAVFILWISYRLASNHLHEISTDLKNLSKSVAELAELIRNHIQNGKK